MSGALRRGLAVVWTLGVGVLLVAGIIDGSAFWVLLAGLALVGGVIDLGRTRPGAARERNRREAEALAEWTPERLRRLAAERSIDPAADPVPLIAAVRQADPRLSLLGAKRLVDGAGQS